MNLQALESSLQRSLRGTSGTVVRAARQHPGIALGLAGVSLLTIITLVKLRRVAPQQELPRGPVGDSSDVSDEFLEAVLAFTERFRSRGAKAGPLDWLSVWFSESGVRNIPNGAGHAYAGLNQMGLVERKGAGFTGDTEDWLALRLVDQLPFVEKFYLSAARNSPSGSGAFQDASTIYLANLAPAFLSHADDPEFAVYKAPSINYTANAGAFDTEKKGYIAIRDMKPFVDRSARGGRWESLRSRILTLSANA